MTPAELQAVADRVKGELPAGFGFALIVFPRNQPTTECRYICNGSRADLIQVVRGLLAKWTVGGN